MSSRVIVAGVNIREARADDAAAVAVLLKELGYATNQEQAAFRLERLREEPQTLVLIVEDVDGSVAALGGSAPSSPSSTTSLGRA